MNDHMVLFIIHVFSLFYCIYIMWRRPFHGLLASLLAMLTGAVAIGEAGVAGDTVLSSVLLYTTLLSGILIFITIMLLVLDAFKPRRTRFPRLEPI